MRRPDRLLLYKVRPRGERTFIEALFVDCDDPIAFSARLSPHQRDFEAEIWSVDEEAAERFLPDELLAACFCSGGMEPEFRSDTEKTEALDALCTIPNESND